MKEFESCILLKKSHVRLLLFPTEKVKINDRRLRIMQLQLFFRKNVTNEAVPY